jgi:quinol monooxygenase YgiN
MRSQLASFQIDPARKVEIQRLAERWIEEVGRPMDGLEKLSLSFSNKDSNHVVVRIDFRDQAALDKFSEDEVTMKIVEELKEIAQGAMDYSEADSAEHTLA